MVMRLDKHDRNRQNRNNKQILQTKQSNNKYISSPFSAKDILLIIITQIRSDTDTVVVKRMSSYQLMFIKMNLKTILCSVISLMVCTQFLIKKLTLKSGKYNPQ